MPVNQKVIKPSQIPHVLQIRVCAKVIVCGVLTGHGMHVHFRAGPPDSKKSSFGDIVSLCSRETGDALVTRQLHFRVRLADI